MWRRFNRSKDPTIGSPTLIETTFDQQYLDTIPEVDSLRSSGQGSGTSPGLPELPFRAVEPLAPPHRPQADERASSIYSQPGSDTLCVAPNIPGRLLSVYSEVSPLTSPRGSADFDTADSPDVSPIEPRPLPSQDFSKAETKTRSHLPVLRKVSPAGESTGTPTRPSPSWRRASEEDSGSSKDTTPSGGSKEERLTMLREKNRKLLSGFQETSLPKTKQMSNPLGKDPLDHPVYREPWKGASGRTVLVEPVRNTHRPRNESRPLPKRIILNQETGVHSAITEPRSPSASPKPSATPVPIQPSESILPSDEQIKPIAPLKIGNNTTRVRSSVTAEKLSAPFNPRYSDATVSSYENGKNGNGDVSSGRAQVSPSTPAQYVPRNSSPDTLDRLRPSTSDGEPASRFSWTTYATTPPPPKTPESDPTSHFSWTTYAPSVNESPHTITQSHTHAPAVPPVPYMPNASAMRKRPMPSNSVETNTIAQHKVNRKPTPSNVPHDRASSLYSTNTAGPVAGKSPIMTETPPADRSKSLPQCPPEVEAKDRIAALEARTDDLRRRRRNIDQILKELNSIVQPTSFAHDLATRQDVKKTVKGLEDELADIRIEEHQIGMTLHRALKKRDQENGYGGRADLWIKRVTS